MRTVFLALVWDAEDRDIIRLTQILCRERGYGFHLYTTFTGVHHQWHDQPLTVAMIKRSLDISDDGLAFCRTIRADDDLQHLPLIVGWADMPNQAFEAAYAAGANGCFGRVYHIDGVFRMIERLARDPTQTQLVDQVVPHRRGT